jgi:prepilin-type N-terminal cleavage/methylation domain-containing protein
MRHLVRSTQPQRPRARRGFTIVELLVAIMLFSVGVLALAATSASILAMSGDANRRVQSASIASSVFEKQRSISCTKVAAGSSTSRGLSYFWTAKKFPSSAPRTVEIAVTVTVPQRGAPKTYFFRNVFPC